MRRLVNIMYSSEVQFFEAFLRVLRNTNPIFAVKLSTAIITFHNLADLLFCANSASLFDNKKVVLICDEIDSLGMNYESIKRILYDGPPAPEREAKTRKITSLLTEGRAFFLTDLETIKNDKKQFCLQAVIGITNCVGEYLLISNRNSPFNIQQMPYFVESEVFALGSQWEKQENTSIDILIKKNIFQLSNGAQGAVVMLFKHYVDVLRKRILQQYNREPNYADWYAETLSGEFWNILSQYANFKRMVSAIESTELAKQLVQWSLNRQIQLNACAMETFIKSNILCVNSGKVEFASPLVERYLNFKLDKDSVPSLQYMPLEGDQVDVVTLVCEAVKYMNRFEIISQQPKKPNHMHSKFPESAYEIAYITEFNRVLQHLTRTRYFNYNVTVF